MMKSYLFTAVMLAGFAPAFAQQGAFVLKGTIKGQQSGMLKLSYMTPKMKIIADSCVIKNGAFVFKGKLDEPVMAFLEGKVKNRDMDDPNAVSFFMEPAQMTMELTANDFKNLKVKGSKTQDDYKALEKLKAPITAQMKPVSEAYKQANEVYMQAVKAKKSESELEALKDKAASIRDGFEPFQDKMEQLDIAYIKGHPDSYLAAYLLRWRISSAPLAESKKNYAALSDKVKKSSYGKAVLDEIKGLEGGSPGSVASVFNVPDINGNMLNLADFKGQKYVLLDFWASWCVPCRKGNPHLLSLYSKYKDKGLEIIGVSDDDSNHEAWKKAVEKDQIGVWKHVLRGLIIKGNEFDKSADISEPYGIHSLPTKILIDKNGVIVGRYGGGGENDEAMDKKLAEIFN